jgi:preprotein translocase subunit SecD
VSLDRNQSEGSVSAVIVRIADPRRGRALAVALVMLVAVSLVAGCGSSAATSRGSTAGERDLQLRPVLSTAPLGAASCPSTNRDGAASATPVSACSADGSTLYSLGAAVIGGAQVSSLSVQDSSVGGAAEIQVILDGSGKAALANLTKELVSKPAPQSQVAIYIHGRVQSAPAVMEPITSGALTITGDFTRAQAQQLVDGLVVR